MEQREYTIIRVEEVAPNIHVLRFSAPSLVSSVRPGQFLNVRVADGFEPLLRRPFSVYRADGDAIEILFNVVGRGTLLLSRKKAGEMLDVLGPLGVPFTTGGAGFGLGLLVGGGLGVAPLPITTAALKAAGKSVVTFLGARTAQQIVSSHLENVHIATDDGSSGARGTVVQLLERYLRDHTPEGARIFACGPTAMLRSLAEFAIREGISCEISLEGAMGCGFGICQGCPVELTEGEKKYALMCKDGPTFDVRKVKI